MILFQVIEFLATYIESIIGILIVSRLLVDENVKWKCTLIASCAVACSVWFANQYQLFSLFTTLVGIVGIALSVKIIYKAKLADALMLSVAYLLLIYVIDFLSMSIWGILSGNEQFGAHVIQNFSVERLYHICLTKVILIVLYVFVLRKFVAENQLVVRKLWAGIIIFGILVFYFGEITFKQANVQLLAIWCLLMLIVLFGAYSGIQYFHYQKEKNQIIWAKELNHIVAQNYENMIQNYRDNQIQSHDIKNHFLVIEGLVKDKKYEAAEEYINSLKETRVNPISQVRTGVDILDFLLEYKRCEAVQNQINFEVVADKIQLKLTEQEITALFGNALDNAIEACKRMAEGIRWLHITIRKVNDMTFIKVANSFEQTLEEKDKKLLSTKSNEKEFGWGMMSMQVIVDKYGGTIRTGYEIGHFVLMISFYN